MKKKPPPRVIVGWCANGHLNAAVLPSRKGLLVSSCVECPGDVPLERVAYDISAHQARAKGQP